MKTFILFFITALAEISGCFAAYAVLRLGRHPLWLLPGAAALALFAWLLTLHPTEGAGRIYAAYGGVYIAASLLWLWQVEGLVPDRYDFTGVFLCLLGAGIIMLAPRT
jgi:small multidrug resistance family-3 protein